LIASIMGGIFFTNINQYINNGLGAASIIISGIIMLIQVQKRTFRPHSQQTDEIEETFKETNGNFQKRTALFLGLLAGIPPCVFEVAIYSQAVTFSASSGIINGIMVVFFFGIGTWIGLFPLAAFGLIGPLARNKFNKKDSIRADENSSSWLETSASKIELISAIFLIALGVIFLVLAILKINIFTWPEVPPI
ncbi:MAG: hypothetical protein GF364_13200, partial [Candidatus Lokiarchaeota archaeon]|nr:hypothetical protein [Candidatus Lokiarchaeota archaeon]